MTVLEADDISKEFTAGRETRTVLRGISLELRRGEVVAPEGPSGVGVFADASWRGRGWEIPDIVVGRLHAGGAEGVGPSRLADVA